MIKRGLNPRFAEVGKIKIGGKGKTKISKNGKEFQQPEKFDHFKITTTEKDETGNFIINDDVMKRLGSKPREIPIRLLVDDIDTNFFTSFQYYIGGKRQCVGDGETATWFLENGDTKTGECNPDKCPHSQSEKCKISGILSCMIDIPEALQFGGVYRFRTHGWNSVSNILAALQFLSQNTNGILAGLPLKLRMLKKNTQDHGPVWTVTIVMDTPDVSKIRKLAYQEQEGRKLLNINISDIQAEAERAGLLVDTDDPEDVQAEFYPEPEERGVGSDDLFNILEKQNTLLD